MVEVNDSDMVTSPPIIVLLCSETAKVIWQAKWGQVWQGFLSPCGTVRASPSPNKERRKVKKIKIKEDN